MNEQTKLPGTEESAFPLIQSEKSDNIENMPYVLVESLFGLSKREYACIHLKVPESGTEWLDELITKSLRDDFAGQALTGFISSPKVIINLKEEGKISDEDYANIAYLTAGAMLQERNNP